MKLKGRIRDAGLWPRLLGFALIPLAVQAFQPAVGGLLIILAPLPLAYGMTRRGLLEGTGAVAFVGFLTFIVAGSDQALFFMVETVPLCIGIRHVVLSRLPLYRSVSQAVGLVALVAFAAFILYSLFTGLGFGEIYREAVARTDLFMEGVVDTSRLGPEETQQVRWMVERFQRLFIGIEISTLIFLVTIYALIIKGWMTAAGLVEGEKQTLLSAWSLPFPFVLGFICLSSFVILTGGAFQNIALNVLLPLGALYGIQGMVVAGHMFTKWELPSFFRALFMALGLISFPVVFMTSIALGGLFDTWIDFRKRWPIPELPAPPTT